MFLVKAEDKKREWVFFSFSKVMSK